MAVRVGKAVVFMDKDGTLLENLPYNVDPDKMRLAPGAQAALRRLGSAGVALVVVSNQSGVARGLFPEEALAGVAERLRQFVEGAGALLLDFCYCPHLAGGTVPAYSLECHCRKPKRGLLLDAAWRHGLDLSASWMVGDILDDVEAGRAAGCRTILVDRGNETEWEITPARKPDHIVTRLDEAAEFIVESLHE